MTVEIFTNAPSEMDLVGTAQVGEVGDLRIVSLYGTRVSAETQILRYRTRGYFATLRRRDAVEFVMRPDNFVRPPPS